MKGRPGGTREAAAGIILAASLLPFASLPASAADSAVILQYHHFGEGTPRSTSVTMDQFREHLDYLEANAFAVWPVEKIVSVLRGGGELPEKCVGITIDDGYVSVYERAWPLLRRRGYPFTVFVTTEGMDKGYESYITWNQVREMFSGGVQFGAHGHDHGYLVRKLPGEGDKEWTTRVRNDIARSVRRLAEETGAAPSLFAYPYGEYNPALQKIVSDLGLTGFAQQSGPLWRRSDFTALPRFPMAAGYADLSQFAVKVRSLPLPVLSATPEDPVLPPGDGPTVLRLALEPGEYARDSLTCFGAGGAPIDAAWEGETSLNLRVSSANALPEGRSKYTCTARHRSENRYFWYTHLWIKNVPR